jgi:Flp pilus assembly protein TadD
MGVSMSPMLKKMGLPALLLAGVAAAGGVAVASNETTVDAKAAAKLASRADRALDKRQAPLAVQFAEAAVAASPRDAGYRALLGQAYLQAGRFVSARTALEEALSLDPRNGRVALNLVLTQVATGDWTTARTTLDRHADVIPASDRGLALALAGDPAAAVALLTQAARGEEANPKTRQNLALSLALAGQWQAARVIAAADMNPGDVDARMLEWAAFAQPASASDQVAHLLGVRPAQDGGRPVTLALNAPTAPVGLAEAAPMNEPAARISVPIPARIVFADRKEIVQALPTELIRPHAGAMKVALSTRPQPLPSATAAVVRPRAATRVRGPLQRVAAVSPAPAMRSGEWHVQIGAFDSPAVARDAWGRATRRLASFQGRTPAGVNFSDGRREFYRLSVGGLQRADAVSLCRQYRAKGGACFVRMGAGDQVASWLKPQRVQLASR